jgi:hypothetical protein
MRESRRLAAFLHVEIAMNFRLTVVLAAAFPAARLANRVH